jgi:hypothetical protein
MGLPDGLGRTQLFAGFLAPSPNTVRASASALRAGFRTEKEHFAGVVVLYALNEILDTPETESGFVKADSLCSIPAGQTEEYDERHSKPGSCT